MDAALALHTFARRTCMTRFNRWAEAYSELARAERIRIGDDYTDEAYAIFPRYRVLEAILERIEEIDADALPEFEELRATLVDAAKSASSHFTNSPSNATKVRAMIEERERLALAFRRIGLAALAEVRPLFYRRTLGSEAIQFWRSEIQSAWGADGGYWFPLGEKSHSSLLALELACIDAGDLEARIKQFFRDSGVDRVVELREDGPSCEVQADFAAVSYNGAEGFWTTAGREWVIYCSHEGTITLGGKAAADIGPEYAAACYDPLNPHWLATRQ